MRDRSLLLFLAPFAAGLTVHVACVDSDETPSPSLSLDGGGLDASRADVVQPTEPSVDADRLWASRSLSTVRPERSQRAALAQSKGPVSARGAYALAMSYRDDRDADRARICLLYTSPSPRD